MSYSGGHVLPVAAFDRRVKCVSSRVPAISGWADVHMAVRPDLMPGLIGAFEAARGARYAGEQPLVMEVLAEDPKADCALPGQDCYDVFTQSGGTVAPAWHN